MSRRVVDVVPHRCHAEGCDATIPPRLLMCRKHWRMVPRWLQRAVWAAYRPGQEDDKRPSLRYLLVQCRARIAVAREEGVDASAVWGDLRAIVEVAFNLYGEDRGVLDDATRGDVLRAIDNVLTE